jgi:hypothetical protein
MAHVAGMFALVGEVEQQAQTDARAMMDIESHLALASRRPQGSARPAQELQSDQGGFA